MLLLTLLAFCCSARAEECAQDELEFGRFLLMQSKYAEAENVLKKTLARMPGVEPDSVADIENSLGVALLRQSKFSEAEPCFRSALAKVNQDVRRAKILSNLAICLDKSDQVDAALETCEESIRLSRSLSGVEQSVLYNSFGNLLRKQDRLSDAQNALGKAVDLREKAQEPIETLLPPLVSLAETEMELGELGECEIVCKKIIQYLEHSSSTNKEILFAVLNNLASVEALNSEYAESAASYKKAQKLAEEIYGPDSSQATTCSHALSEVLDMQQK